MADKSTYSSMPRRPVPRWTRPRRSLLPFQLTAQGFDLNHRHMPAPVSFILSR
jgi:hypothetical protein